MQAASQSVEAQTSRGAQPPPRQSRPQPLQQQVTAVRYGSASSLRRTFSSGERPATAAPARRSDTEWGGSPRPRSAVSLPASPRRVHLPPRSSEPLEPVKHPAWTRNISRILGLWSCASEVIVLAFRACHFSGFRTLTVNPKPT